MFKKLLTLLCILAMPAFMNAVCPPPGLHITFQRGYIKPTKPGTPNPKSPVLAPTVYIDGNVLTFELAVTIRSIWMWSIPPSSPLAPPPSPSPLTSKAPTSSRSSTAIPSTTPTLSSNHSLHPFHRIIIRWNGTKL